MEKVMKESKFAFLKTKSFFVIVLAVTIFLQLFRMTYYYSCVKETTHCDEIWSFGLANSFYEPFIYGETLDDNLKIHQWQDGSVFSDYITVNEGERFRYDSVWYNQSMDMHPPLYYAILHTICSFFPGKFSYWFGFVINIAVLLVGLIFLTKAAFIMTKSKFFSWLACAFWGFSIGFINVGTFVRMYAMMTMFSILFIYGHIRLYYGEGSTKSNLIRIAFFTFFGALTHHFFLVGAFIIAACFCFYYLFKKQFKLMLEYGCTLAGAVLLSIAAFPATIDHLFLDSEERMLYAMPFFSGFRTCIHLVLNSLMGVTISSYSSGVYAYFIIALVFIVAIIIPLCFLFHKEEWFKRLLAKIKEIGLSIRQNFNFMLFFMLIGMIFVMSVISVSVNINTMNGYTDRYLFFIMPWAVLFLIVMLSYVLKWIKPLSKAAKPISLFFVAIALFLCTFCSIPRYLLLRYIEGEGGVETTVTPTSNHILVLTAGWTELVYSDKLMGCGSVFATTVSEFRNDREAISQLDLSSGDCYVSINISGFMHTDYFKERDENDKAEVDNTTYLITEEAVEQYENLYTRETIIEDFEQNVFPGYRLQFYGSEFIINDCVHTYKVVPESEYVDVPVVDYYTIMQEQEVNAE